MSNTIILGGWYRHKQTGKVMRCEAAGAIEYGNYVHMVDPDNFAQRGSGFTEIWRDSWAGFQEKNEWEMTVDPKKEKMV